MGINNRCPVCEEPPLASCPIGQSGQGDVAAGGIGGGQSAYLGSRITGTWAGGCEGGARDAEQEQGEAGEL